MYKINYEKYFIKFLTNQRIFVYIKKRGKKLSIQIGIITSDNNLVQKVLSNIKTLYNKKKIEPVSLIHLKNKVRAYDFINYEFPEYLIFNMNDEKMDCSDLLKLINNDPWFHSTGILIILDRMKHSNLPRDLNKLNILSFIDRYEIDYYLSKTLEIILTNRQVLVQKDLAQKILEKMSGSFVIDNDPLMVSSYVNILTSTLVNERYINPNKENVLRIALTELIMNGIEHGNCEISYEEKSKYLEEKGDINELIKLKNQDPEIAKRKVYLDYTFTDEELKFVIRDCGKGFDYKKRIYNPNSEQDLWKMHGRGIFMTQMYVDSIKYNDIGNEVTITIKTDRDKKTVPEGFSQQKEITVKAGDIVLKQGERSNCLYYIVNGIYEIILNDKKIAELNPSDVFLGEMSFLLNNKRIANVVAKTDGKLIEISKKSFINIIKKYPHYGLFLARLLAKRLERNNKNII